MSFASLEAAAPHINSRFTLITDDISSDGNLLLHHFLALHLKSGRKVNLVGADQSLFHYSSVAKKAGLTLVGNSQFHHTNALVAPYLFSISASTLGALGAELKAFVERFGHSYNILKGGFNVMFSFLAALDHPVHVSSLILSLISCCWPKQTL